ncbi:MAG TPA: sulfatase-like hydrolase/transferase [Acidisarcina sp.]|nr:sulfatase-like hydrolase/transferase [Acidisarcina sp.]
MSETSRREFLKGSVVSGLAMGAASMGTSAAEEAHAGSAKSNPKQQQPNIVLICSDQFRADFIGAYRENTRTRTPNLDRIVERGTAFKYAITPQPLCSPARSCMITGRYATETGEWRNVVGMDRTLPTLASVLRSHGYTANFIGKWHLMKPHGTGDKSVGYVPPEDRGGFLDLWEGSNSYEGTTHPYEGSVWDGSGDEISYKDQYRIDFITERAVRFLRQPQQRPFLLYVSQLEPHQQNNLHRMVAPNGYAENFKDPFVPADLRPFPGDWQTQLPDYYGCVQKIDESVGTIIDTLREQNLLDSTIVAFISDHGCQFKTRNTEYKRSPHDSSIRIPFIFQGPGFDSSMELSEVVSLLDLTPTLLSAAGVPVPESMKGRNLLPLITDSSARRAWDNVAYVQISESMLARAIRTKEWCYCVVDPTKTGWDQSTSTHYYEYQMYNLYQDPAELVNLAGRQEFKQQAAMLREELKKRLLAAGEQECEITPATLYP